MPKIAEIREIDGGVWARVEMRDGSPIQFLTNDEIDKNREREQRYVDLVEAARDLLTAIGYDRKSMIDEAADTVWLVLNQQTTEGEK
jgi:S-adenosylmethionine synthetase